jgi:hypothetical protein
LYSLNTQAEVKADWKVALLFETQSYWKILQSTSEFNLDQAALTLLNG